MLDTKDDLGLKMDGQRSWKQMGCFAKKGNLAHSVVYFKIAQVWCATTLLAICWQCAFLKEALNPTLWNHAIKWGAGSCMAVPRNKLQRVFLKSLNTWAASGARARWEMQFSVPQPRTKQNMSCSYCAICKFFPPTCLLSPSSGSSPYSGSSSWMTNRRDFCFVRGIKQSIGHGSTSPRLQPVCRELWGISECVRFFQCCCAKMQGSLQESQSAACMPEGSLTLGVEGEQQMWDLSRVRTLTWVNPLKCCNHKKPVMADGFLHLHH